MAVRENDRYYEDEEKKAGQKAARTIQRNWKNILSTATTQQTGVLLSLASARAKMRDNSLEAINVTGSPATFKQHYGFEGIKKNGVAMSMKPFNHFGHLFNKSDSALKKLVEEIAEIRGEKITTKIQESIAQIELDI